MLFIFFMFSFIALVSSANFIGLSRFTVITVGCMKTSFFTLLIFSKYLFSITCCNCFSTEVWSCKSMRRPFCCFGTQFPLTCPFISRLSTRPYLENISLNSMNSLTQFLRWLGYAIIFTLPTFRLYLHTQTSQPVSTYHCSCSVFLFCY